MGLKLNILFLLFAACIPHLYSRINLVYKLETSNHPSKLEKPRGWITEKGKYEVKYEKVLRNCEDVVLDQQAGYAVISCDEGRDGWNTVMGIFSSTPPKNGALYLYDYTRETPTLETIRLINLPQNYSFHPLGLSLHIATNTLLVTNHGINGSTLDQYHFSRHGNSATYIRSFKSPFLRSPNSVLQITSTSALVTNDHFFTAKAWGLLSNMETYLGLPFGSISHVDLKTGEITQVGRVPFANGIALLNDTTVAIASSSTSSIRFYSLDSHTKPPTLASKSSVTVPFFPDNLHAEGNTLLVAGHPHLSSFSKFTKQRLYCGADTESKGCDAQAPSYVMQWTEANGTEKVYVGKEIFTSSKAAWDRKRQVLVVSGLYGKGILVWRGGDSGK